MCYLVADMEDALELEGADLFHGQGGLAGGLKQSAQDSQASRQVVPWRH